MTGDYFTLDAVLGQAKAKKMLRRAVAGGRLSHAYLFRGPAGVGKKTLARAFGHYLNCQAPTPGQDACTTCRSCQKFQSGNHPDLLVIEPQGVSIKIEQIRALKHALTFPPFEANFRIILITDIQTMRREAANSLLKILEEPPPGNQLLLTGDEAGEILPTIISRCQSIPFSGLADELVAARLVAAGVDPAAAAALAAIAAGSLGRAAMLSDQELLDTRRAIIAGLLALQGTKAPAAETVFQLAERAAALNDRLPELLELLKLWFRDLIMLASDLPAAVISRDLPAITGPAATGWSLSDLFARLELCAQARRQLARNCSKTLVCEDLFFGLL
jgi:DNA polymerase-3 subunit delta'